MNEMNEWISINESLPKNAQEVYVITDCEECWASNAIYVNGKFIVDLVIQCDRHLEPDQRFSLFKIIRNDSEEYESYTDRITHWYPKEPKEFTKIQKECIEMAQKAIEMRKQLGWSDQ